MTIVNELNKLAEKITGTNPKATTDKKVLDYIADYYAEKDLKPITNAQAVKNITENYVSGITPTGTIEISENGTYDVTDKASAEVNVSGQEFVINYTDGTIKGTDKLIEQINEITVNTGNWLYLFGQFKGQKIPKINLTTTLTSLDSAFMWCQNIEELDLSYLNTSNVTNMNSTFAYTNKLNVLDVSSWNFSSVTNSNNTFGNCGVASLEVNGAYADGIPYVYVKDATAQNWVLTATNGHPDTWTTNNVVIKGD